MRKANTLTPSSPIFTRRADTPPPSWLRNIWMTPIIENEDFECIIGTNALKKFTRITLDYEEMLMIIDGNETLMGSAHGYNGKPADVRKCKMAVISPKAGTLFDCELNGTSKTHNRNQGKSYIIEEIYFKSIRTWTTTYRRRSKLWKMENLD